MYDVEPWRGQSRAFTPGRWCAAALAAWLAFAGSSAQGASWYVDNAASGANNGTSWASAWTSFSAVVWGTSGVKAGDTLFISGGGATYSGSFTVGASGTASAPISIRVGQDAGHNGTVNIDLAGSGTAFNVGGRSYITIDGSVAGVNQMVINNGYAAVAGDGTTGIIIRNANLSLLNRPIRLDSSTAFSIIGNRITKVKGESGNFGAAIDVDTSCGGAFDVNRISDNYIEIASNGYGPDGIRPCSGLSMYNNIIKCIPADTYTVSTGEHTDVVQGNGGSFIKVYNNEFINVADAGLNFGIWTSQSVHDIWVYNNIFRMEQVIQSYPEYFRIYANPGTIVSLYNIKLLNNLFIDSPSAYYGNSNPLNDFAPIVIHAYGGSPTAYGNEIRNNIFYNVGVAGSSSGPTILIEASSGFTSNSFQFSNNTYYNCGGVHLYGTYYSPANWIASQEPSGQSTAPQFVRYVANASNNDYHLKSTDTAARDKGTSLGSYFSADKDGVSRPQGSAWDIGPYEYNGGVISTNPILSVSVTSLNFGSVPVGSNSDRTITVANVGAGVLAGSASVAVPFSIVSGASYSLGANQSQNIVIRYLSTGVGSQSQNLSLTGGSGATVGLTGSGFVPTVAGLDFSATSGTITAPFTSSGAYISQATETTLAASGRAAYSFTTTNAGTFVIQALLNAPGDAANSIFLNVDAEPQDPAMIWDIPFTSGFELRLAAWRGNGTFDANQFVPKYFSLTQGIHQLIVRGREANVQLDRFSVIRLPDPPQNLRLVSGP